VLAALREEGLVRAAPGIGTVVAESVAVPVAKRVARRRPSRPVESTLTRERIVAVAVAVADAEGLDAVSMRRVAVELGASTMALYGHVGGKTELVRLMVDAVAEPGRAPLDAAIRARWRLVRRHPWLTRTGYLLQAVDRSRVAAALAGYLQGMAAYLEPEGGSAVPLHIDALFEFGLGLMLAGLAHRHR
jgi:AcrR family transcriptional regulator